jgi:hypothetical protein
MKFLLDVNADDGFVDRLMTEISHDILRAELHSALNQPTASVPDNAVAGRVATKVWSGTATALALMIKNRYETGQIPEASSIFAALRWAGQHYMRPDRSSFDAKSLAQLLYKKRRKDAGNPVD